MDVAKATLLREDGLDHINMIISLLLSFHITPVLPTLIACRLPHNTIGEAHKCTVPAVPAFYKVRSRSCRHVISPILFQ